jgi:hypothetical protein
LLLIPAMRFNMLERNEVRDPSRSDHRGCSTPPRQPFLPVWQSLSDTSIGFTGVDRIGFGFRLPAWQAT